MDFLDPVTGLLAAPISVVRDTWREMFVTLVLVVGGALVQQGMSRVLAERNERQKREYTLAMSRWARRARKELAKKAAAGVVENLDRRPWLDEDLYNWELWRKLHPDLSRAADAISVGGRGGAAGIGPAVSPEFIESLPPPPKEPEKPKLTPEQARRNRDRVFTLVALAILVVLLPFVLAALLQLLRPLPPGIAWILGLVASAALYWFKKKQLWAYGAVECVAGSVALWVIVAQPQNEDQLLAQVVGFAAGVYVIVRGLGNLADGMPKTGWKFQLVRVNDN